MEKSCFFATSSENARLYRFGHDFGSILEGLGVQVGAMLGEVGPEIAIFGLFWALLGALGRLALILNFNKNMLESYGDEKWSPGTPQLHFRGLQP